MVEIKLDNGFTFELEEDFADNMELVDALAEMENDEDALAVSKIATLLFGNHKKAIYDSFRTESKRVPVSSITKAIKDTFDQLGQKGKN